MELPPLISFFTGAGFLDLGFAEVGFRSIWHNEYDESFRNGFEFAMGSAPEGFGGSPTIESGDSIVDVGPREILRAVSGLRTGADAFGVVGGPPCPDFSVGGKNRGGTGENGVLTEVFVDRICELQPEFFVLENVPGLVRTSKHREFFERVTGRLDASYLYSWEVLNALDFGAPQDRRRLFVVGFRRNVVRKLYGLALSKTPSSLWNLRMRERSPYPNALSAFQWPRHAELVSTPRAKTFPVEMTVANAFGPHGGRLPSELPNGLDGFRPKSTKFSWIKEGDDSKKSFKRLHRWRYSPAAAYGNNEVHIHPLEPRRISVREAMRIQTVPDWYSLPPEMTLSKKFKTVGNGVPVKLARAVAEYVRHFLQGDFDAERKPYARPESPPSAHAYANQTD